MKTRYLSLAAALLASAAFAAPTVSNVTWTQEASGVVRIGYDLGGEDAVVTIDVQKDGASIGQERVWSLSGDVNRMVRQGAGKKVAWRPDRSWPNQAITEAAGYKVNVVAWAKDNPPDYMAVNLSCPEITRYYTCAEAVPFGVTNALYKGEFLLMRRIHAAGQTFLMGSPETETGRRWSFVNATHLDETTVPVSFSADYYIGVYELTKVQAYTLWSNVGAPGSADEVYQPMTLNWNYTRGGTWPNGKPNPETVVGKLASATGIDFDLPTEAQWEFACRAGSVAGICNGGEIADGQYARGVANQPMCAYGYTAASHDGYDRAKVGTLLPNDWGLYDMHGNVDEWCLDWVSAEPLPTTGLVDPVGLETGTMRALRGGCSAYWPNQARCGARGGLAPGSSNNFQGARVTCPAVAVR